MKILYVITRAERGGAQVHLVDMLANLPPEFKPIVATGERGYLCEECAKLGVPVRYVPGLTQPVHPLKDLRALVALIGLIRREKPDVVHAHTSKAGLVARFAARITGAPAVFTAHTWSFAEGISAVQRGFAIPLERLAAGLGGKIITVSEANKEMALRRSVATTRSLVRIWNGIPDVQYRAKPGTREFTTLITVARFAPQKDHRLLLHALADVGGNWRLILAGAGPRRREVEVSAKRLGLIDRIDFVGDRSDIPQILSEADIFILPSKWEGLPLSILEAMRAGLPVIATDVGGVAETVTDGVTGYLTARDDVSDMRERIQTVMGNVELMRRLGRAGRRRYEKDFRLETMVEKTLAIYREVCGSEVAPTVASEVSVQ
jgi:glycosyltransferase involved in cell wall biosynthesis